jgi:hypothetical protein
MKRLSLPTRMRAAQALTILAMVVAAWCGGQWLMSILPWWAALPLAFVYGWYLGKFTMTKVMPRVYEWVIRRWINEQPPELRYLLLLRMHFEFDHKER